MKMCWKCGKPHKDGDAFCMYCGASFASESERYQSDGRTVSDKDDTEYLRSDPPKYKRSHTMIIAVAIIALVAVGALVLVINQGGSEGNIYYNYEKGSAQAMDDKIIVSMDIVVLNDSKGMLNYSDVVFRLRTSGGEYEPIVQKTGMLESGWKEYIQQRYTIPMAEYSGALSIIPLTELNMKYDSSLEYP